MPKVEDEPTALSPASEAATEHVASPPPNEHASSLQRRTVRATPEQIIHGGQPRLVGPYQVGALIGRGGMGEVFAGFDPRLERPVAIKRVSSRGLQSPQDFLTEARHAARLSHPGIVRLYDVVQQDDANYIVSELVDGLSLSQVLEQQPSRRLSLERTLEIAVALSDALAYAHDNAVVHRDIKPANVLVARNGEIKLADFGVSTTILGLGPPTEPIVRDVLSGTVHAMSPEQSIGDYTDARSDLFSLGILIYEMTTGISPFLSHDPATSLQLVRESRPLPIAEVVSDVPSQLSGLLDRLLEKRREDRPESAREVLEILGSILRTLETRRVSALPGEASARQLAVACLAFHRPRPSTDASLRALEAVHDSVVRVGGTLLTSAGDRALMLIGHPTPHENNCEVAIKLLIGLQSQLAQTNCSGGVDCGVVALVQRGTSVLASGEAIDAAQLVADAAEPGTVRVTLAAQNLARRFFRFAPVTTLPDAQQAQSRQVYRIIESVAPDAGLEQVTATPLCARERHLELIDRGFQDAQHGLVITRLLVGEAGVGKSRLLHEWCRRRFGALDMLLTSYATAHEQGTPFAPLIRLWFECFGLRASDDELANRRRLDAALRLAGIYDERFGPTLAWVFGLTHASNPLRDMPAERRRRQIIDIFVGLVLHLGRDRTVVLSLEDLHFVDRSTLEVLHTLAESPKRARVLMLLTTRPEFLRLWPVAERLAHIELERLSSHDAMRLVESITSGASLPASTIRTLVAAADGIPLVLEELTRSAIADADTPHRPQALHYPTSLADSVSRRVEELGPAREVLRVAAVLGRQSVVSQLRAIAELGTEELTSRLRKLEIAGLIHVRDIEGEAQCIFTHALVQDAVRTSISPADLERLYSRIASVLERAFTAYVDANPGRFAHIYAAAKAYERALALHERASQHAFAQSAHAEASAHLQAALSLLSTDRLGPAPQIERRLRRALGPSLMALEGWSSGLVAENLQRSRALQPSENADLGELWAAWAHAIVTHDLGPAASAIEAIRSAAPSPEQRFVTLSTQGVTAFYRGQWRLARPFLEQAVAMLPSEAEDQGAERIDLGIARGWGCEFVVSASLHLAWMDVICDRRCSAERVNAASEALLEHLSEDRAQRELRHGLFMRVQLGLTLDDYEYFDYASRHARGALHRMYEIAGSQFPYYRSVARIGEARARVAAGDARAVTELIETYHYLKSLSRRATGHVFLATIIAGACLQADQPEHAAELIDDAIGATELAFGRFYAPEAFRVATEYRLRLHDQPGAREMLRRAKSALIALDAPPENDATFFARRIAAIENTLTRVVSPQ